jgi:hypothetical protein
MRRYWLVGVTVVCLWTSVSFAFHDAGHAEPADPAPLLPRVKTVEGEKIPPPSAWFARQPLGFDLHAVEKLLTPVQAPTEFYAALDQRPGDVAMDCSPPWCSLPIEGRFSLSRASRDCPVDSEDGGQQRRHGRFYKDPCHTRVKVLRRVVL